MFVIVHYIVMWLMLVKIAEGQLHRHLEGDENSIREAMNKWQNNVDQRLQINDEPRRFPDDGHNHQVNIIRSEISHKMSPPASLTILLDGTIRHQQPPLQQHYPNRLLNRYSAYRRRFQEVNDVDSDDISRHGGGFLLNLASFRCPTRYLRFGTSGYKFLCPSNEPRQQQQQQQQQQPQPQARSVSHSLINNPTYRRIFYRIEDYVDRVMDAARRHMQATGRKMRL